VRGPATRFSAGLSSGSSATVALFHRLPWRHRRADTTPATTRGTPNRIAGSGTSGRRGGRQEQLLQFRDHRAAQFQMRVPPRRSAGRSRIASVRAGDSGPCAFSRATGSGRASARSGTSVGRPAQPLDPSSTAHAAPERINGHLTDVHDTHAGYAVGAKRSVRHPTAASGDRRYLRHVSLRTEAHRPRTVREQPSLVTVGERHAAFTAGSRPGRSSCCTTPQCSSSSR
jgi:hypothetical protein